MAKGRGITEEQYDQVKLMQGAKLTVTQTTKIMGLSWVTVDRLYRATTWQEYADARTKESQRIKEKYRAAQQQETIERVNPEPEAPAIGERTFTDVLNKVLTELTEIHNLCQWIVDHAEVKSTPSWLKRAKRPFDED